MGKNVDLRGQRFGKLVAIEPTDQRKNNSIVWRCRCDCGNEHHASANHLRKGSVASCGCAHSPDLAGQRFGKLVAIEPTDSRAGSYVVWRCRCDCGKVCEVSSASLRTGNTRSCGCGAINGTLVDGTSLAALIRGVRSNNSSGIRGVFFNKRLQRWCAQISFQGRTRHLGAFDTLAFAQRQGGALHLQGSAFFVS